MHHPHLRVWDAIHRWTSLGCTLFLLLLCLTGLPLIFHDEINRATQPRIHVDPVSATTPSASLDRIIEAAIAVHPGMHPLFASHEPRQPRIWYVTLAAGGHLAQVAVDGRSAAVVGEPSIGPQGVMGIILALHSELFAGLKGKLFLGAMGMVFFASLVSGVAIYAPFKRGREFSAVRKAGGARSRWLDLHNLMGITTLLWASVVCLTGVINTCSEVLLAQWRSHVLSSPLAVAATAPPPKVSLQDVLAEALSHVDGEIAFIAFPGSSFAGESMFGIYSRGKTALTSRLVRPILIDARTANIESDEPLPWYLTLLLISQPLHFGDYGGLPLKVLWALLDILTIAIIGSGVYLWVVRKRPHGAARSRARKGLREAMP